jgi:hypothetical protein
MKSKRNKSDLHTKREDKLNITQKRNANQNYAEIPLSKYLR